ncbi:hypothetical protein KGQ34_04210 [Patescibacteria group bacterium]|nr:hypothetical protein [Patescibacteria group bacterium]
MTKCFAQKKHQENAIVVGAADKQEMRQAEQKIVAVVMVEKPIAEQAVHKHISVW